ncbi:MAG: hypothetical protein GWP32_05395 [Bacteroidetes bacterium]|nr:hypothetical protein [Bacteroidota bacterium]
MKKLFFFIILTSHTLFSQEVDIAVWDFNSDSTEISGGTATELTNTNLQWLNSGSADADANDGAITVDNVSTANSGLFATGLNVGGTGKYHFSIALNNWNITSSSESLFHIRFKSADNKVVASIKIDENKVNGSFDGDKTRVVGSLFSNSPSGAFKSGGHFGPESLAYSTPVNIGLTLDFDNDTYEYWTGTPNSPTDGKEFYYDFTGVSGNMPSSLAGVIIDHIQLNAVLGAGDSFTIDQIKISSGEYNDSTSAFVDAGIDISACEDESSILITGAYISDSINNFVWSIVQGDGTITNSSSLEPIYSPSPSDISNGQIILQLTGSTANEQLTDQMTIALTKNPTVFAGTDAVINQGEDYLFADAMASDYSYVFWTHTGSGVFSDPSIINPIYTPNQEDYNNGSVTFSLNATSITPCSNTVVDEMTLSFTPTPTVYAGEDLTVCGNEYVQIMDATVSNVESLIWTSSGDGSFTNSDSLSPHYLAGPFDIESGYVNLTLTATGSGQTVSDTMTINFSRPQIQLYPMSGSKDQVVCDGDHISDIVFYLTNGSENVQLSWDVVPIGINSQMDPTTSQFILSGTPHSDNQDTVYNYTLKAINMVNGCESEPISGSITVWSSHDLKLLSSSSSTNQILCEGDELPVNIIYEFGGGADSIRVLGLPNGINYTLDSNKILTISGAPADDITTTTEYEYTVETLGNDCSSVTMTGTIIIIANPEITLLTPSSTLQQFVCEGNNIEQIQFKFNEATTDVICSGLPPGVTGNYNDVTKVLTISGKPNQDIEIDTQYDLTVKAMSNDGCMSSEVQGVIIVQDDSNSECIDPGKIELNGPVEVNNGTLFIKEEDGLILKSSQDNQCYRITIDDGNIVAVPVNCEQ